MMKLFNEILAAFIRFTGDGWGIWGITMIFLMVLSWKDKDKRSKILWPAVLSFAVIFNPFFYKYVGMRFMSGVYWRMFWLIPIPLIIACGGAAICSRFNKRWLKMCTLAGICAIIVILGKSIFTKDNFTRPTNIYQIPQSAVDVSDAILQDQDYEDKRAIVPNELLCYVRQYTSNIELLYGRNAYGYISPIGEQEVQVHKLMSQSEIYDRGMIGFISIEKRVNYVVFNKKFHVNYMDIDDFGYFVYYQTVGDYVIYRKKIVSEGF